MNICWDHRRIEDEAADSSEVDQRTLVEGRDDARRKFKIFSKFWSSMIGEDQLKGSVTIS